MGIVRFQRILKLLASGGIAIVSASATAADFPSNEFKSPAISTHSYFGPAGKLTILDASSASNEKLATIRSLNGQSSIRYRRMSEIEKIELVEVKEQFEFSYIFSRFGGSKRFELVEVKRRKREKLFDSVDDVAFDESPAPETARVASAPSTQSGKCEEASAVQAKTLLQALNSIQSCGNYASGLSELAEPYSEANAANVSSPIACMNRLPAYASYASNIQNRLKSGVNLRFACDSNSKSNFDEKSSTLNFGAEILNGSRNLKLRAFMHEFLHVAEIKGELEVNALVNCCADPSKKNSCVEAARYGRARERSTNGMGAFALEALDYLGEGDQSKLKQVFDDDDDFAKKLNCDRAVKQTAAQKLNQSLNAFCDSSKAPPCKSLIKTVRNEIKVRTTSGDNTGGPNCKHVARNANVDAVAGTAPAAPAANPQTPPQQTVPQTLTYSPATNEPAAVRREVERIRQPLMAAREYGGSIARTVYASMGTTAYAANSSLPRRVSKTEWASAVKAVDPKSGRVTLDLGTNERGQQITGSASMAFDGSQFSAPQVDIKTAPLNLANRVASNRAVDRARPARVEISDSTREASEERSLSIPGRLTRETATTSGRQAEASSAAQGAPIYSASRTPTASVMNSTNTSLGSEASNAPGLSAAALKRMLVKTSSPDVLIRNHIDDLKTNSMRVRYRCVWYPQNFKGTQLFDLDAYQGRKCGTQ